MEKRNSSSARKTGSREEQRRALANRRKKRAKRRQILFSSIILIVIIGIGVILSLTIFFRIETIKVDGSTRYEESKIIEVSGIETQKNMFLTDVKQAEEEILKQLPYIGQASVTRSLPGEIVITVKETSEKYAVLQGDSYVLIDGNTKVLTEYHAKVPGGVIELKGITVEQAREGEKIVFKENGLDDKLKQIEEAMDAYGLTGITIINVSENGQHFTLVYQDRITLVLGNLSNLNYKVKFGKYTVDDLDKTMPDVKGTVDLTNPQKAYFNQE